MKKERIYVSKKYLEIFKSANRLKDDREAKIVLRTMHLGKIIKFEEVA